MTQDTRAEKPFQKFVVPLILASVLAVSGCSGGFMSEEEPPESAYTEAEVYEVIDQAIADIAAVLPDFQGFNFRGQMWGDCTHNGEVVDGYTNVEISYTFNQEVSKTPLVRETYVDSLREFWTSKGYEITRDQATPDGENYSIEASREDGISYWYIVAPITGLKIFSGCVPSSPGSEMSEIAPPGVMESESEAVDAVAPFEGGVAMAPVGTIPWSREPEEPKASGSNLYNGQL